MSLPLSIKGKKIIGLPVETLSGEKLGKVADFDVDPESHLIVRYYIKSGLSLPPLSEEIIITRQQVIRLTAEKMIVDDGVAKEKIEETSGAPVIA